jgi:hypothetical protein
MVKDKCIGRYVIGEKIWENNIEGQIAFYTAHLSHHLIGIDQFINKYYM